MNESEDSAEEEWRFSVDEFDDPEDEGADAPEDRAAEAEAEQVRREIEPQTVRPENALFVVLGVVLTLGVLAHGIGLL